MNLSGHTKPFAVLGHPIGHTLSPVMHNASMQALGMDAVYLAFDVEPGKLMNVLHSMRDMGFGGVNLTVPLKETIIKELPELDDSARIMGAVNTIEFLKDGSLKGHNTDGLGFLTAIRETFHTEVAGRSVLILGSGGAGRALAITCAKEGASDLVVTDLIEERSLNLAGEITSLLPDARVKALPADKQAWKETCLKSDLIIQATPVGMKPEDEPLLTSGSFRKGHMVYDLIYMFPETSLLSEARRSGARISNGLGMLLYQGARAFTIWTGLQADVAAMRNALENSIYP
ncbi:shikimate dehydrogenase [Fibrobacterota bacterium]